MPYNDDFYSLYQDYLFESSVRKAHDWIFGTIARSTDFKNVIDLGCGEFQEFRRTFPDKYVGIDVNPFDTSVSEILHLDYRQIDWSDQLIRHICRFATGFVSLFSTEITAPVANNYALYERLFNELPNLRVGLVSGFYYTDEREGQNPVMEAGGICSYQTLESPERVVSGIFTEKRIVMPVPSKMFGPDVWEVWKIFERRKP